MHLLVYRDIIQLVNGENLKKGGFILPVKNIKEIIKRVQGLSPLRLAITAAGDEMVLESVKKAHQAGIIDPIMIGNLDKIKKILDNINYDFSGSIISVESNEEAARKSMELIIDDKADLAMKGLLDTSTILHEFLKDKYELRQKSLLSLITVLYLEREGRIIIFTDSGMNIAPTLGEKVEIIKNAAEVARTLGIKEPKVAVLAAVEKVNEKMPATIDAAILSKMADRGQLGKVVVDGPLALDNAVSQEAATKKGIISSVAGQADILLVPDIEAGNILYKSMIVYGKMEAATIVYGAKVPVILTSRADSINIKFNSIALASLIMSKK